MVTLKLDREQRLPRFDTLLRELPWHFALRDILSMTSPTQVLMKNLNKPESDTERVVVVGWLIEAPFSGLFIIRVFDTPMVGFFGHLSPKELLGREQVRSYDVRASVKLKLDLWAHIAGVVKHKANLAVLSGLATQEGEPLARVEVDRELESFGRERLRAV